MHKIKENVDKQLALCGEGAVLHLGRLVTDYLARLRPSRERDRCGDDRLVRHRMLCYVTPEGAISGCPTATTSKQGSSPTRSRPMRRISPRAIPRRARMTTR